jgi:hypothetical protein
MTRTIMVCAAALIALLIAYVAAAAEAGTNDQDLGVTAYQKAVLLLRQGKAAEAAAKFEALLSAYPDSHVADDASFYLGYCWEKLGHKERAFRQYGGFLADERFRGSGRRQMVLSRASEIALELRQVKGDDYDRFLTEVLKSEKSECYKLESAYRLAQLGNWSGQDVLLEGLETGDDLQKVRIIELLRYRLSDENVRKAMEAALTKSDNDIVRMTAASALAQFAHMSSVRETMTQALLKDGNPIVRINAVHALARHISEDEVEKAFEQVLLVENDPIVLRGVIIAVTHSDEEGEKRFEYKIVKRLKEEKNPLITMTIVDSMRNKVISGEDFEIVVEPLVSDPEPVVRMWAINALAPRVADPKTRIVILNTLENDPNPSVKISALHALSGSTSFEDVRHVFLDLAKTTEDMELKAYTVHALAPHLDIPEVRESLVNIMVSPSSQPIAGELVTMIVPASEKYPEIQDAAIGLLETSNDLRIKINTAARMVRLIGPERFKRVGNLYLTERNLRLGKAYFGLLSRTDAAAAEKLQEEKEAKDDQD